MNSASGQRHQGVFSEFSQSGTNGSDDTWDAERERAYRQYKFDKRPGQPQRRALVQAAQRLADQSSELDPESWQNYTSPELIHQESINSSRFSACLGPYALNDTQRFARKQYLEDLCEEQRQRIKKKTEKRKRKMPNRKVFEPPPVQQERESSRGSSRGSSIWGSSVGGSSLNTKRDSQSERRHIDSRASDRETSANNQRLDSSDVTNVYDGNADAEASKAPDSSPTELASGPSHTPTKPKTDQRRPPFSRIIRPKIPKKAADKAANSQGKIPIRNKRKHESATRIQTSAFLTAVPNNSDNSRRIRRNIKAKLTVTPSDAREKIKNIKQNRTLNEAKPFLLKALSLVRDPPDALQCQFTSKLLMAKQHEKRDEFSDVNFEDHKFSRISRFHELNNKQDHQYTKLCFAFQRARFGREQADEMVKHTYEEEGFQVGGQTVVRDTFRRPQGDK